MTEAFGFSLPTTVLLLNIGIVSFIGIICLIGYFKTRGWQRIFSTTLTGVLLVVFIFLVIIFPLSNNIRVDDNGVILNALPFGNKTLALNSAEIAGIIDWQESRDFEPTLKTNGASTGSYKVGWFKLRNGSKAFLMTARSKVFVFKSEDIYYLISPDELEKFSQAVFSRSQSL